MGGSPKRTGPEGCGAQILEFFPLFCRKLRSFFSLSGGLFMELWPRFVAGASNRGHISTRRPPEREERTKVAAEKGKKFEIVGGPADGGPAEGQQKQQQSTSSTAASAAKTKRRRNCSSRAAAEQQAQQQNQERNRSKCSRSSHNSKNSRKETTTAGKKQMQQQKQQQSSKNSSRALKAAAKQPKQQQSSESNCVSVKISFFCLSFCLSVFLSLFLFWRMEKLSEKRKKGSDKIGPPPELVRDTGKRAGQHTFHVRSTTDTLSRNFSLYEFKRHRRNPSAGKHRENCRGRRRTNRHHNSNAHYCKKTANHELSLTSGNSQNSMVVQQRLKISELQFNKFQTLSSFSCWKIRFKTEVNSRSDFPSDAVLWIKEVEMVVSLDELKSSQEFFKF